MAEGAPLLREYRVKSSIEGSNPSHSASFKKAPLSGLFCVCRFLLAVSLSFSLGLSRVVRAMVLRDCGVRRVSVGWSHRSAEPCSAGALPIMPVPSMARRSATCAEAHSLLCGSGVSREADARSGCGPVGDFNGVSFAACAAPAGADAPLEVCRAGACCADALLGKPLPSMARHYSARAPARRWCALKGV